MNLTSKSRYAIKLLMDLAENQSGEPIRRLEMAGRQGIPPDYMDQILVKLRAGDLVKSVRGRQGGYQLGREPGKISVWDIFLTVEEFSLYPVECLPANHECDFSQNCISKSAWQTIFQAMREPLEKMTLADLVTNWKADRIETNADHSQGECRSGKTPRRSCHG